MDFGLAFILLMPVGGLLGSRMEHHEWNGGKCHKHGARWVFFGTTSQGCQGYSCYAADPDCTTWQTYGHDSKEKI